MFACEYPMVLLNVYGRYSSTLDLDLEYIMKKVIN